MTPEAKLQADLLLALNRLPHVRVFRNNVGFGTTPAGLPVRFGLCPGSSDLIGWCVRDGVAVFLSIEVKSARGRVSTPQKRWIEAVNRSGGIAFIARSVEEAIDRIAFGN